MGDGTVGKWEGTKSLGRKEGWAPSMCGGKQQLVLHRCWGEDDTGGSVMEDEDSSLSRRYKARKTAEGGRWGGGQGAAGAGGMCDEGANN